MTSSTLVAGIGNVFLGDDGFGVEVVNRLGAQPLPAGVEVVDIGIRGVHLAHQLLDGYDIVVLVDAMARGDEPGTLTVLEVDVADVTEPAVDETPLMDAHSLAPDAVIRLVSTLSGGRPPLGRVLVVGCEPEIVDVGMGLSACVTAALDPAVELVMSLLSDRSDEGGAHDSSTVEGDRDRDRRRSGDPVVAGRGAVSAVAGDVIPAAAACGGEV